MAANDPSFKKKKYVVLGAAKSGKSSLFLPFAANMCFRAGSGRAVYIENGCSGRDLFSFIEQTGRNREQVSERRRCNLEDFLSGRIRQKSLVRKEDVLCGIDSSGRIDENSRFSVGCNQGQSRADNFAYRYNEAVQGFDTVWNEVTLRRGEPTALEEEVIRTADRIILVIDGMGISEAGFCLEQVNQYMQSKLNREVVSLELFDIFDKEQIKRFTNKYGLAWTEKEVAVQLKLLYDLDKYFSKFHPGKTLEGFIDAYLEKPVWKGNSSLDVILDTCIVDGKSAVNGKYIEFILSSALKEYFGHGANLEDAVDLLACMGFSVSLIESITDSLQNISGKAITRSESNRIYAPLVKKEIVKEILPYLEKSFPGEENEEYRQAVVKEIFSQYGRDDGADTNRLMLPRQDVKLIGESHGTDDAEEKADDVLQESYQTEDTARKAPKDIAEDIRTMIFDSQGNPHSIYFKNNITSSGYFRMLREELDGLLDKIRRRGEQTVYVVGNRFSNSAWNMLLNKIGSGNRNPEWQSFFEKLEKENQECYCGVKLINMGSIEANPSLKRAGENGVLLQEGSAYGLVRQLAV